MLQYMGKSGWASKIWSILSLAAFRHKEGGATLASTSNETSAFERDDCQTTWNENLAHYQLNYSTLAVSGAERRKPWKNSRQNAIISISPSRMTAALVLSPYLSPSTKPAPMATTFCTQTHINTQYRNFQFSSSTAAESYIVNSWQYLTSMCRYTFHGIYDFGNTFRFGLIW